jgi:alpha-1,3-rhamnosyl/mannosyltransferase
MADLTGTPVIGLGVTSICKGSVDGIANYTSALLDMPKVSNEVEIQPIAFGSDDQALSPQVIPGSYAQTLILQQLSMGLLNGFRRIPSNLSLFHAPDNRIPSGLECPVIATIHDVFPLTRPELMRKSFRRFGSRFYKRAMRSPDHIITISRYSKAQIEECLGFSGDQISIVWNGIDDAWFKTIPEAERQKTLDRRHIPATFFLAVGTIQPRKNYARIISAFASLPRSHRSGLHLVIVGKNGWNEDLASLIEASGVSSQIMWFDDMSNHEVRSLFQSAKALVFPSLAEGFGYPIAEAYASGCPVITSNTTSMPEVAGDSALYVDPLSTDEIRSAMIAMLERDSAIDELIRSASQRSKLFTKARMIEQTLMVYKSVLGRS